MAAFFIGVGGGRREIDSTTTEAEAVPARAQWRERERASARGRGPSGRGARCGLFAARRPRRAGRGIAGVEATRPAAGASTLARHPGDRRLVDPGPRRESGGRLPARRRDPRNVGTIVLPGVDHSGRCAGRGPRRPYSPKAVHDEARGRQPAAPRAQIHCGAATGADGGRRRRPDLRSRRSALADSASGRSAEGSPTR